MVVQCSPPRLQLHRTVVLGCFTHAIQHQCLLFNLTSLHRQERMSLGTLSRAYGSYTTSTRKSVPRRCWYRAIDYKPPGFFRNAVYCLGLCTSSVACCIGDVRSRLGMSTFLQDYTTSYPWSQVTMPEHYRSALGRLEPRQA
jgi:hypothetical protein